MLKVSPYLGGEVTCGWNALGSDNTVRWVAVDADQEDGLESLQQTWEKLDNLNLAVYLENSRRGGHLWVFVEGMRASVMRTLTKLGWRERICLYELSDAMTA